MYSKKKKIKRTDVVYDNKTRDSIPKRGYYSELVSDMTKEDPGKELCAKKRMKLILQAKTDKLAPTLTSLPKPQRAKILLPPGRWTTYKEDESIQFPFETFVPKLQFLSVVLPKELPRLVKIERLRRKFLAANIKKMLRELGIQPFWLLPPSEFHLTDQEYYGLYSPYPKLDLEIFDNTDFDCRIPEEWLSLGMIEGEQYPCPGLAFIPKEQSKAAKSSDAIQMYNSLYEWTNVAAFSFDKQTQLWEVMALDGTKRYFNIPRIRLMFKADDPETFANRVKFAVDLRREVENNLRFYLYLDCLILEGLPIMPRSFMPSILQMVRIHKQARELDEDHLNCLKYEAELLYKKMEGKMKIIYTILSYRDLYNFVDPPTKDYVPPVPDYGRYPCIMDDFSGRVKYNQWNSLYVLTEAVSCIHLVVDECLKVESMLFFTTNYGRNVSLAEFDAAQQHCTTMMLKYLNITWLNNCAHAIRMSFRDVGKGWYNIYEKKWEFYGVSKLSRFMQLVRFRMQYALRFCIEQSMDMFVTLCETPCLCTYWCSEDYEWDSSDLINTPFRSPTPTLFYFHLMINADGPFYTTDPAQFEIVIQRLFREMLYRCHFIPQVHPMIMTGLVFDKELFLTSIGLMEPNVVDYRERLLVAYRKAVIPLLAYLRQYECYTDIFMLDTEEYVENFRQEKHSASETREEVQMHYDAKQDLIWRLPQYINIGPFALNVDTLKQILVTKRSDIIRALLTMWAEEVRLVVEDVVQAYKGIMRRLGEKPNTIEHVFEIREWMESVPFALKTQEDIMKKVNTDYEVLDAFFMPLENDDFKLLWEAVGWPLQITKQVDATTEFLEEEQEKFWKLHQQDEQTLYDKIDMFTAQCMQLTLQNDFSKVHEIANDIKKAWKGMKDAQDWGRILNQRQKLFGQPVVPFSDLNRLVKEFEPYRNLWVTASDFLKAKEVWFDNPLMYVDADSIEPLINEYYKTIVKCTRTFADLPKVQEVAIVIRDDIDEFRPLIPVIQAVRNPGMKERHWNEFMERAGITVTMNEKQTFSMCLKQGVAAHAELIAEIGELASKEYVIEQALDKMLADWSNKAMEIAPYKNTGTFIMKIADETLQLLDEHLMATQQLGFSPFKAAFELRIQEWDDRLRLTQKVVDEWIECQKEWMYLEPIFTSEDISRQLPLEAKKYGTMERIWRRIMSSAAACPKIMLICPDSRLLDSLVEARHLLAVVSRGLNAYMELKRLRFPRFFFLSDDELLEILAQSRNPRAVQPHLRKCFEAIAKVTFEPDLKITYMHSCEGEIVELKYKFYPSSNVEQWLLLLEDTMRHTIRLTLVDGMAELWTLPREEWVLRWPGQVVIAGSQTAWTAGVENAIEEYMMDRFVEEMLEQLDRLRSLVKGELTFAQRAVVCALIVIEVHARDVTRSLFDDNVKNVTDFQWIVQLRYYQIKRDMYPLEDGESPEIYQDADRLDTSAYYRQFSQDKCDVKALNSVFTYQNEYLGNSGRLVITPLTDRCYVTLMCAMHLKFGGAPAGPAGTGKTETTKDLAKALAVQCVVFNCSDQLDYMAMGKFFKGLAASGAWACFDEFNRIDIEVLSVVAQQVVTIQKAQVARLEKFMFEGCDLPLKASCSVFITMNPGYAGRTELPDNLKALFRPISMMVPDYALIAEISLFSYGFYEAKILAGKITTTFRLSSEQLSSQDHYDFGMRAVKTVILVAGNLIRQMPDAEERQIVLRSLRDVNVPKFLADDLLLFNGIISDLFPRVEIPVVDYGIMEQSIRNMLVKKGYDDLYTFIFKIIQLYETTVVRHGLMLVGPAGSGKTKCYEILRDALTAIRGKLAPDGFPFTTVLTYIVNPKSITMGQLYGEFDLQTHEWTDGILSSLVRAGIAVEDMDRRWYIFDGPVDAVWIENMNTVLDDNKKLCLSSGEIMKLTERQRMIFEVADLAVASPATVSRCGMVYLDTKVVGLPPLVNAWLKANLPPMADNIRKNLPNLINTYLYPSLQILRTKLTELVVSIDCALVLKFLELLDYRLRPLTGKDDRPPPGPAFLALMPRLAPCWVVWAVIWSVGATCDHNGRAIFSDFMRKLTEEAGLKPPFPKDGRVYDYTLHDGGFTDMTEDGEPANPFWYNWMANLPDYEVDPEWQFADIEVPTLDNVRSAAILGYKVANYNHAVCVGPTGTGKTVTITSKLSRGLHKKFICEFIVFSARTSANQTQDVIDNKLERRRRGVFGPPPTKRLVFFIDDLNMPALEVYGAQPPIELLRQFMDFSGWYDRTNIGDFRLLVDINMVAAMGPPGGGRNPVTMRLMRHFHYISFTEMEYASKYTIFHTILTSWTRNIIKEVKVRVDPFLKATIEIFQSLVEELLPTPAKSHYTFNLRDLSKVFQGMLMMDPAAVKEEDDVIRLWYHEHQRVYQDRLVNDEDRKWFLQLLNKKIRTEFGRPSNDVVGGRLMLFGDFMDIGADDRKYIEITDREEMDEILLHYMEEYNLSTTVPLQLVLFEDAASHLCRIARIVRQPMANALLLGMGGSGRQSLSRLASHMAELTCIQIEITKAYGQTEWRDDLRQTMMKAGADNRGVVFLFSDAQIKMESFLEDLNNILSSGDVPNIYEAEDLDRIYVSVRHAVMEMNLPATKTNLFACYQRRVRSNLHVVVVMSPVGEIFRARLRQFPSLVNCCTIDWFSEWPKSALESVATHFFGEMTELQTTDEVIGSMVSVCCFVHQSVVEASARFLAQLNRLNYVTPMSYMEMLHAYADMFKKKRGSILKESNALKTGLNKLNQTEVEVKELQIELADLKPLMEKAADETRKVIERIAIDTAIAEEARIKVEKEQAIAEKMATETTAMAEDAQRDLDEAMPALKAAEKALQELNRNDVVEVKAMKKPPAGVVLVIESLCVVFDIKPIKEPGASFGEKVLNYWKPGSAMLSDPTAFLDSLMKFDKESITEDMIKKLKRFIANPDYDPAKILKVSKACMSLCMWVHAMFKFYHVNKAVAPKKEALQRATTELAAVEAMLANAKAKMQALLEGIAKLNAYLQEKEDEKRKMEEDINQCLARMDRANRLLNGLSSERVRWIKTIADLDVDIVNLIGDILLSACAVGYVTPFTDEFRRDLLEKWITHMVEVNVPHTHGATPLSILGDAVQIRNWQMYGLPRDPLSVESAVLMSNSRRWPLVIDPQTQANKWIRAMGKIEGLIVCKPNDRDLLRSFESALRFGKPILLENVGQELDPALDPVLKRQYFRQAGQLVLKLGDSLIPYIPGFRLYITTKLPNPRYTPETSVKVQIVNFALVPSGLAEQLLSIVVAQERPDLEELRGQLIVSRAQLASQLAEMQADILYGLSNSEGSPVDDLPLILTLEAIKIKSAEIIIKVDDIERTTLEIDEARGDYVPVANRGQILFFCLAGMANVDPMYQYSLEWFVKLFVRSMAETEQTEDIVERVEIIIEHFTFLLYQNVCRSLFERHKLLFAFLLCARILLDKGVIRHAEFNFLLNGGKIEQELDNPEPKWVSLRMWLDMQQLASLHTMNRFVCEDFKEQIKFFRTYYDAWNPHKLPYPKPLDSQLDAFQKLLVLKCLRPDKLVPGLQDYVVSGLGARFVEPQPADLAALYAESDALAPIIFVLSTGTDPAADLLKFADKMKMGKRFESISLGQGQGPLAEAMMRVGCDFGNWVFFQNCHLSPSWMPILEINVEQIQPELVHKDFRLWLTSTPSPHFPVALLQNGYKMTVEPPRGIKANLLKAYMNQVPDFVDFFNSNDSKVPNFKWLLFSLCLFHGVVLERRKFGPLGFNIPYEFTDGDLRICISQLHMFLIEYAEVPLKMLTYTAGHINYGGRVTDDWDRRCLLCLLSDYYTTGVLNDRYMFDETGAYKQQPVSANIEDYTKYIRTLPLNDDPSLFGLHSNANISYAMSETSTCLNTLKNLQPKEVSGEGGMSAEEMTERAAKEILEVMPPALDQAYIAETYPVSYKESLNTVLIQEAIRYNRLLGVIKNSLRDLLKALKGLVVMSEALESMANSLARNAVPLMWSSKAYPSLKPLAAWVKDLCLRVQFMQQWADGGIPKVFWISGFYFPQAFLTGALQNYARKHVIAIDTVAYAFEALPGVPAKRPDDGCCVRGLYLEGARWNVGDMSLEESRAKELHTEMAIIYMKPEQNHKLQSGLYECPTYKTLVRAGTLSTTGHSTNYVMTIELPTHKPPAHWIKRGVALFCALDY
ncbi:dynein axonemal heavy chain 1-like [Amyelois transitella]|uniref:dynein axonemal heavy chain 1-like n=1 Tax=Amyelois transitella TaxID=680683 RepID=UPI0029902E57|nr:dynein axonemal heavy chain 1-like [Amyelois transitella]